MKEEERKSQLLKHFKLCKYLNLNLSEIKNSNNILVTIINQ